MARHLHRGPGAEGMQTQKLLGRCCGWMYFSSAVFCMLAVCLLALCVVSASTSSSNRCLMSYMHPLYTVVHDLTVPANRQPWPYSVVHYRDGRVPVETHQGSVPKPTLVVLYIPGNAGSYKQVRSLGSNLLMRRQRPVAIYALDLKEELSAISDGVMQRQAEFAQHVLAWLRHQHAAAAFVLVGHSVGGLIARLLASRFSSDVHLVVTLATPHIPLAHLPLRWVYKQLAHVSAARVAMVSLNGGTGDWQVTEESTWILNHSTSLSLSARDLRGVWLETDHQCITWCRQIMDNVAAVVNKITRDQPVSEVLAMARLEWLGDATPPSYRDLFPALADTVVQELSIVLWGWAIYRVLVTGCEAGPVSVQADFISGPSIFQLLPKGSGEVSLGPPRGGSLCTAAQLRITTTVYCVSVDVDVSMDWPATGITLLHRAATWFFFAFVVVAACQLLQQLRQRDVVFIHSGVFAVAVSIPGPVLVLLVLLQHWRTGRWPPVEIVFAVLLAALPYALDLHANPSLPDGMRILCHLSVLVLAVALYRRFPSAGVSLHSGMAAIVLVFTTFHAFMPGAGILDGSSAAEVLLYGSLVALMQPSNLS